jgi:hypothetical protein
MAHRAGPPHPVRPPTAARSTFPPAVWRATPLRLCPRADGCGADQAGPAHDRVRHVPTPALRLLGPAGRAAVGLLPGHPTRERIPRLQRDVRTLLAPMRALPRPDPPRCGPFPLRACANRQHAYLFRGAARVPNRKGRPCAAPHRRALRRGRRQVSLEGPTRPRAAPLLECDRGAAATAGGGRCGVRRAVAERGRTVALVVQRHCRRAAAPAVHLRRHPRVAVRRSARRRAVRARPHHVDPLPLRKRLDGGRAHCGLLGLLRRAGARRACVSLLSVCRLP